MAKRPTTTPPRSQEYVLPSGETVSLARPDLFGILGALGTVPDPITATVMKLLEYEGVSVPESHGRYYEITATRQRGMYGIYALCRTDRSVDLDREYGDGEQTLGRRDIPWGDVEYVYYSFFRSGHAIPLSGAAAAADAGGPAEPARDRDDVPPDAS